MVQRGKLKPRLTPAQVRHRYDLKYHSDDSRWPDVFETLFKAVCEAGKADYKDFKNESKSGGKAWMKNIRGPTDVLVNTARNMQQDRAEHSENAWRGMEPFMFRPLEYNPTWYVFEQFLKINCRCF